MRKSIPLLSSSSASFDSSVDVDDAVVTPSVAAVPGSPEWQVAVSTTTTTAANGVTADDKHKKKATTSEDNNNNNNNKVNKNKNNNDDEDDDAAFQSDGSEADELAPKEFICPLTLSVMIDPVLTRYGHNYEREAILQWLARDTGLCPISRRPLRLGDMITNHQLRTKIHRWRKENDLNIHIIVSADDLHDVFGYVDIPNNYHPSLNQQPRRRRHHHHDAAAAAGGGGDLPLVLDQTERSEDDPDRIVEDSIRRRRRRQQRQDRATTATTTTAATANRRQGGGGGLLRRWFPRSSPAGSSTASASAAGRA
jgi:hypothetical protein